MRPIILGFVAALGAVAAQAQAPTPPTPQEAREKLTQLYMIAVSQDLCGFTVTEKQSEAISKASDEFEDKSGLSEEDADKLYGQIEEQMKKQKETGLCAPDGDWAKTFKQGVEALAK